MKSLKFRYAPIELVVQVSDGFIFLEQKGDDAIYYKLDLDFNSVWEKKIKRLIFNLFYIGSDIKIPDGSGEADLNPDNGEINNWILTK